MKKHFYGILSTVMVLSVTTYVLLDTFILRSVYSTDASVDNSVAFAAVAENMESSSDDTADEDSDSEESAGDESETESTYTDEDGDVYAVTDNTSKTKTNSDSSNADSAILLFLAIFYP